MRKARFTEHQLIAVLKSVEAGRTVKDICRKAGISETSDYNWKAKYGGIEDENRRLKQMFAVKGNSGLRHVVHWPLAVPQTLNHSRSVGFMHDALNCGRLFRTFNAVDDDNREALAIEIDLNIPAQCSGQKNAEGLQWKQIAIAGSPTVSI